MAKHRVQTFDSTGAVIEIDDSGIVYVGGQESTASLDVDPDVPIAESDVTGLVADLALKAPLPSPVLTGHPTGVTESALNNSTSLASTAYADAAFDVE